MVFSRSTRGSIFLSKRPNAQVQGRALGMAEARSGAGVPCNAQLGAALVNGSLAMFGPIGEHFAEEGQFSL